MINAIDTSYDINRNETEIWSSNSPVMEYSYETLNISITQQSYMYRVKSTQYSGPLERYL